MLVAALLQVVFVVVAGEKGGSSKVAGSLVFGVNKPGEQRPGERGDTGDFGNV